VLKRGWAFIVPGEPIGWYAHAVRADGTESRNYRRYKAYHEWCKLVRDSARAAGVRLPPDYVHPDAPWFIGVRCIFSTISGCPDCANVQKGAADALFWTKKERGVKRLEDNNTSGAYDYPHWSSAIVRRPHTQVLFCPAAEVELVRWDWMHLLIKTLTANGCGEGM